MCNNLYPEGSDQDGGVAGHGTHLLPQIHQKYIYTKKYISGAILKENILTLAEVLGLLKGQEESPYNCELLLLLLSRFSHVRLCATP